ncbi:hypothetical protein NM688_g121 [Phlebia brevispora]|uniref:Uncharacterized protein n=1 Tax=Phlebia brevispora TaxID=194682 RepID=A0ACC1TEX1_9APHY|nr:hypothetical protein NM688_g121 [Phlebia brevispora]
MADFYSAVATWGQLRSSCALVRGKVRLWSFHPCEKEGRFARDEDDIALLATWNMFQDTRIRHSAVYKVDVVYKEMCFPLLVEIHIQDVACVIPESNVLQVLTLANVLRNADIMAVSWIGEPPMARADGAVECQELRVGTKRWLFTHAHQWVSRIPEMQNVRQLRIERYLYPQQDFLRALLDRTNVNTLQELEFSVERNFNDESRDMDDRDPEGRMGQRSRALAVFLCQLPRSLEYLNMDLWFTSESAGLATVDWDSVSWYIELLPNIFKVKITLRDSTNAESSQPCWTTAWMDLLLVHFRGVDVASVDPENQNEMEMYFTH